MAKSKVIDMGRDKVTVRELTLEEIHTLFETAESNAADGILNMLTSCSDAKRDKLLGQAPSDMQPLVDGLVEVNSSFLGQCRQVNNKALADSFENLLRQVSLIAFLQSSPPDTATEPGATATPSS
jgi:hypothetical protein